MQLRATIGNSCNRHMNATIKQIMQPSIEVKKRTKLDKEQIFMLTFSYGTSDEQLNRGCDNIEF